MPTDRFAAIRQAFGDTFIRYVLAIPDDVSLDCLHLVPRQEEAVAFLEPLANSVIQSDTDFERAWLRTLAIAHGTVESGTYNVTLMRQDCGGSVPDTNSDDEVEKALLECVRDAYPVLLLPVVSHEIQLPGSMLLSGISQTEAANRLRTTIFEDEDMVRLFPESDGVRGDSYLTWEAGESGILQAIMLPELLTSYALVMAALEESPTIEKCLSYGRATLATCRALARGERVRLPLLVGLSNIELGRSVDQIDLVAGKILRPTTAALNRLGPAAEPNVTAVLATEAHQRLVRIEPASVNKGQMQDRLADVSDSQRLAREAAHEEVRLAIDMCRYSLLLASNGDAHIAALVQRTTRFNPLSSGTSVSLAQRDFAPYGPVTLDKEAARQANNWAVKVCRDHPRSLNIGMRRVLSAVTVRDDPMDGFIDAVMCWENLFGESQETSFKVCGSLAMLLELDDEWMRTDLFSKLKKLYEIRSKLVHGSAEPDALTAVRHRDEAVSIALRAMRRAYDVPGLLQMRNSTERYKRVLLGVNPPNFIEK
ncbi:hypothetical protein ONO86_00464 [Micromonospora noduli]|uniref:HEPN domain-containing protein n=1 Tax=Micromonospora noduli TaxID=709876 RepID=UPI000DC38CCC|nr:HEPN domain-containing protein [Micromonospora noduli]RAO57596.1 hypothetical protein ONO86_00464 [Micromonospora noduli]